MSYICKHALDSNDVIQKTVLTCINEVADFCPKKLVIKLKVVCEALCNILKSNKPQMVFKAYQTIRNLSQMLKVYLFYYFNITSLLSTLLIGNI